MIRVYLVPGPRLFHFVAGLVLLTLGGWIIAREYHGAPTQSRALSRRAIASIALAVGVVGGVYGIGGGSILGPVLVGTGIPVAVAAPAALAATWVTSLLGASTYALLALTTSGHIAPNWGLGVLCGLGGLVGGYLGAWLQPRLPERALRLLLGGLAVTLAIAYVAQAVT